MKSINNFGNIKDIVDVTDINNTLAQTSSKGVQRKWFIDNKYVKEDLLGYEGVAEEMASMLLDCTSIDHVRYKTCNIKYNDSIMSGCISDNFITEGETFISVGTILDRLEHLSFSLTYDELREEMFSVVGFDIKKYLDTNLCIDSIIKNEDRHFYNLGFIVNSNGEYRPAPIFDNGYSCLSDVREYPLTYHTRDLISNVKAKPFNTNFKNQLYRVDPIIIDVVKFKDIISTLHLTGYHKRALEVITYGLNEMECISWIRK